MGDNDLITRAQAAAAYGVSRQAVEQAFARATKPPEVIMTVAGRISLYRQADFHKWWVDRQSTAWSENRSGYRRGRGPLRQVNSRVTEKRYEQIMALREPGQTVSALAAILIGEALDARRAAS
jgi:hypothetical protein